MSRKEFWRRRRERQATKAAKMLGQVARGPGRAEKIRRYSKAVARWVEAGRPVRSPREAQRIYRELCCPCEHFDSKRKTCTLCGCKLAARGMLATAVRALLGDEIGNGLMAKCYMATEHCDRGLW